jgi:hypothetical protein
VQLGWLAVGTGVGGFAVTVRDVWGRFDGDEAFLTALLLMGVELLATTGRLLLRPGTLEHLYVAHLVLSTFATAATVWLIWDDGPTEDWLAKLLGAAWILAALAWFLVPVLGRTSRPTGERVVGRGPGRFEVELADGETLVVTRG